MGGSRFATLLIELLRGTEAAVGFAFGEQAIGVLAIDAEALGLTIGRMRTLDAGTFVPVDAEPQQVLHQLRFVTHLAAVEVGILDTQQERAAGMAREEPVVERCTRIADVKESSGRRRKADTG